jgi:hypothetical protein
VPVHDVDVDDPGAGVEHFANLLAQPAEVGGENRGSHVDPAQQVGGHPIGRGGHAHIAISMLSPQLLHFMIAVEDMRTIVECSPQLGQTDASSKRCRQ